MNPANTIYSSKRFLGRLFNEIVGDVSFYTYSLVDRKGWFGYRVEFEDQVKIVTPEEVIAQLLIETKDISEAYLGVEVRDVVIGVPVGFYDSQRRATLDAATIAGLNVIGFINAPTAIALAYNLMVGVQDEPIVTLTVLNIGGGETGVIVANVAPTSCRVIASGGNPANGGDDISARLMDDIVEEFQMQHDVDPRSNLVALQRLRMAVNEAITALESTPSADIYLPSLVDELPLSTTITRDRLKRASSKVIDEMRRIVDRTQQQAYAMGVSHIDKFIFSGGTCHNYHVRKALDEMVGSSLDDSLMDQEYVAKGTALYAALLTGDQDLDHPVLLEEITSRTFGINIYAGLQKNVIMAQSSIPTSQVVRLNDSSSAGTTLTISVYERDRAVAADNHLVGVYEISPVNASMEVDVLFSVDEDSIFHFDTVNPNFHVIPNTGRLNEMELEKMKEEAQCH
ncbi:uncharacterized protein [Apostichopus japonicus]|uniref:uncharacterized protein isoform X3 n=1 Tax=Stichopus japonicus TaxID=307972 RepID=UPI003AB6D953